MKIAIIDRDARSLLKDRGTLLARLVELGHEVSALTPYVEDDAGTALEALGVESVTYSGMRERFTPFADLTSMSQLKQAMHRIRPQSVLCVGVKPLTYGGMAAKMAWVSDEKRTYGLLPELGYPFNQPPSFKRRLVYAWTKYMMGGGVNACRGLIFCTAEDERVIKDFGVARDHVQTMVIPATDAQGSADPPVEAILSFMELI